MQRAAELAHANLERSCRRRVAHEDVRVGDGNGARRMFYAESYEIRAVLGRLVIRVE